MSAIVAAIEIHKQFGGNRVLRGVNLTVQKREILALVGPNGSGKSTLFNVIAGALCPESGTLLLNGEEIFIKHPHQACALGIARTFQVPKPFLHLTCLDNVRVANKKPQTDLMHLLELVQLTDKAQSLAKHLNISERKRLDLARALATDPQILLLDEPMAGMTGAESEQFSVLLHKIRDHFGIAIVWIEHVIAAVLKTADRLSVLVDGKMIVSGQPHLVMKDARVIEAYLGV